MTHNLNPPFKITWRRYEFIHIAFWLLKDYCWCSDDKLLWLTGASITFFISIDFILKTYNNVMIDFCHYAAQFIWVLSNLIWAFTELYLDPKYDKIKETTPRYIAAVILFTAYIPIVLLYLVWIPMKYFN